MIPKQIIDEILTTARIEEVIGDFVQLKRSGSSLKAHSPFTDEKTPSFMVSPAKQIFKCFSTGKGGNVVSFIMEHEQFSYPEALKYLAEKYNIEIPEDKPQSAHEIKEMNEKESLYLLNNYAKDRFEHYLHETDEGRSIGLSYFKERGFREDIVRKFELGYCPEKGDVFSKEAIEKGYQKEYLLTSGLSKEKNSLYDFYRGRVIFPIHSITGRVLGFGARTLKNDKKIAKYFNSPESPIYHKSYVLYGIYQAKSEIIKRDVCYLVEGYTDVISLHQNGIYNVVSSSGTSLTKDQIKLIKRYTNNVTLLYDGDAAGIKASFRGIDMLLEQDMNIKIVLFPDGEDPDSFAQKNETTEIVHFLEHEQKDFMRFKSEILLTDAENDPIKKAVIIREMVHSISLIPDSIKRSIYIREVSGLFEMEEQTLLMELRKKRKTDQQKGARSYVQTPPQPSEITEADPRVQPEEDSGIAYEKQELDLIRILLLYGTTLLEFSVLGENDQEEKIESTVIEWVIHQLAIDGFELKNPVYRKYLNIYRDALLDKKLLGESFFVYHEDQEISQLTADILSKADKISNQWADKHYIFTSSEEDKLIPALESSMYSYKLQRVLEEKHTLSMKLKNKLSDDEMNLVLKEITILEEIKKRLSHKLGRIVLK